LLRPDIAVTLAESQNKKATFLREVIRSLELPVEVWANRVESMPSARQFHTVALRAVDNMAVALAAAAPRASHQLLLLAGTAVDLPPAFSLDAAAIPLPNTASTRLLLAQRNTR
jgi:16S rRNA (guanine527-N7)-methyltransferase